MHPKWFASTLVKFHITQEEVSTRCTNRSIFKFSKYKQSLTCIFHSHVCNFLYYSLVIWTSLLYVSWEWWNWNTSISTIIESFTVRLSLLTTELFKKLLSISSLIYLWKSYYHYPPLPTNSICFLAIIFSLSLITNGAESCLIFFSSILFLSCFYFPLHIDLKISQRNQFIKKLFECFSQHTGFHLGVSLNSSSHSYSPNWILLPAQNTRKLFKIIILKVWYPVLWSVKPIWMMFSLQLAMVTGEISVCCN